MVTNKVKNRKITSGLSNQVEPLHQKNKKIVTKVKKALVSHELFPSFLKESPLGIAMINKNSSFIYINEKFSQIHKKPMQAFYGKSIDMLNPAVAKKIMQSVRQVWHTKKSYVSFIEISYSSNRRYFRIYFYPLKLKRTIIAIGMIWEDITHEQHKEKTLQNLLKQKEILLKEIPHRMKNNLQVISSLLNLQAKKLTDQSHANIFAESQNRVRALSLMHEKVYQTNDLSTINFSAYMYSITQYLFNYYKRNKANITLQMDIQPNIVMHIDTLMPCGLIVNEVLSNALQHAFPSSNKGDIMIKLKKHEKEIIIEISDSGIGLPKHFTIEKAKTLGMQLIITLAKQMNAQISLTSKKGTHFRLQFSHP